MNDEKKILIGHSMGSYLALLDIIKNPDKMAGVILDARDPRLSPRQILSRGS